MKAIVWTAYGPPDVLQLQEVEKPTPKDNEVLIKVHAATVTAGDAEARRLQFPLGIGFLMRGYVGVIRPKRIRVLGQELAGEIEAVGKDVTRFKEGDPVFGSTGFRFGAYAEYNSLPADTEDTVLEIKPSNMTFEEAAAVPTGALESLHFLRMANVQPGEKLLINGAGGSIGTFGVQLARHYGMEVTTVDSAEKLDMLRELGAAHVIDYKMEDYTRNGKSYDVIFDVVGKAPYSRSIRSLNKGGRFLVANPNLSALVRGPWTSRGGSVRVITQVSSHDPEDLRLLKELAEAGTIRTIIDRRYPLEETAEAHRYVETGQKKGNVIITVVENRGE